MGNPVAARYETARFAGAAGRNWYRSDPTLRFLLAHHLGADGLAWADPYLDRLGALMGGVVAEAAVETDRHPAELVRYDRFGHEVNEIVLPQSFLAARAAIQAESVFRPALAAAATEAGVDLEPLVAAWTYLLDQADIGMSCALGTGGEMVLRLAAAHAPADVAARVAELFPNGEYSGEAAQLFTERSGGSDLGALETVARHSGDAWRLSGVKWFVSNANGAAYLVLARPEGAPEGIRGVAPFLVLRTRRDGSPNGITVRRLKDKLGTRSVASAEVELADAEGFLLAPDPGPVGLDGTDLGLGGLMRLTNNARLGVAMMGLGCARRAIVEAFCYATAREAFGARLVDQPLVRRTLAALVVDVEAAQALVFDGFLGPPLRLAAPLAKLFAGRLGVTAASVAIELHGGNGYIEDWPVARLFRDAQVNTVWEGPDNVLCLDVRRALVREGAAEPYLARLDAVLAGAAGPGSAALRRAAALLGAARAELAAALGDWRGLDRRDPRAAEAALEPLARHLSVTLAAALLVEQASWGAGPEHDRKALVAARFATAHLAPADVGARLREAAELLEESEVLLSGAFVDR